MLFPVKCLKKPLNYRWSDDQRMRVVFLPGFLPGTLGQRGRKVLGGKQESEYFILPAVLETEVHFSSSIGEG